MGCSLIVNCSGSKNLWNSQNHAVHLTESYQSQHGTVGVASSTHRQSTAEPWRWHPIHWCKTHYHTQIIFTQQPDIINTHIQTHVSLHKLITTSTCALQSQTVVRKERQPKRPGAKCRRCTHTSHNTLTTLPTPFCSSPSNEIWVSELMDGGLLNNASAAISHLTRSSRVILGNFRLGLNQWH